MGQKIIITVLAMCALLLLGGCLNSEAPNEYEKENYVSIQDYTGEGFALRDANPKTGKIAEENRDEVVQAVEEFFLNEYMTEVKVHNIVSAVDGVSVFVESIGEPHFYSFAIVPVDIKSNAVKTDQVWSQEGQVENAIQGGLYAMAYEEEFIKLDKYLESVAKEYPVTGTPIGVIESIKGNGYTTSYYFISTFDDVFDDLLEMYLSNVDITHQELRGFFNENPFDPEGVAFGIEFYMDDINAQPDEEIYDKVFSDIETVEGIPGGEYHIFLNDNYIDRQHGIGKKDTTLEKTVPEGIIKN